MSRCAYSLPPPQIVVKQAADNRRVYGHDLVLVVQVSWAPLMTSRPAAVSSVHWRTRCAQQRPSSSLIPERWAFSRQVGSLSSLSAQSCTRAVPRNVAPLQYNCAIWVQAVWAQLVCGMDDLSSSWLALSAVFYLCR